MPAVWAAVKHRLCAQLSHFNSWALLYLRAASEVSQEKKTSSQDLPVKAIQNLTKATPVDLVHDGLHLATRVPWTCCRNSASLIWQRCECYRVLFFFLPPKKACSEISHRTTWQLHERFPFAFSWDYTCCRMELSQNLTQQLDSVLSLGSTPISNVIGSDLQFLRDLQLSFTKIISSV